MHKNESFYLCYQVPAFFLIICVFMMAGLVYVAENCCNDGGEPSLDFPNMFQAIRALSSYCCLHAPMTSSHFTETPVGHSVPLGPCAVNLVRACHLHNGGLRRHLTKYGARQAGGSWRHPARNLVHSHGTLQTRRAGRIPLALNLRTPLAAHHDHGTELRRRLGGEGDDSNWTQASGVPHPVRVHLGGRGASGEGRRGVTGGLRIRHEQESKRAYACEKKEEWS